MVPRPWKYIAAWSQDVTGLQRAACTFWQSAPRGIWVKVVFLSSRTLQIKDAAASWDNCLEYLLFLSLSFLLLFFCLSRGHFHHPLSSPVDWVEITPLGGTRGCVLAYVSDSVNLYWSPGHFQGLCEVKTLSIIKPRC